MKSFLLVAVFFAAMIGAAFLAIWGGDNFPVASLVVAGVFLGTVVVLDCLGYFQRKGRQLIEWLVDGEEGGSMGESKQRVVVCAALRQEGTGKITTRARHYDAIMRQQIAESADARDGLLYQGNRRVRVEQGFIDQYGVFLTRQEAWTVAEAAGQIKYRCGGDGVQLFSENLY